jgi:2-polyprenyl-3-methyl-5-hydroxy-6-metoxy-1,4-benzoquinol methylase
VTTTTRVNVAVNKPESGKATSYGYGDDYQRQMLEYYRRLKNSTAGIAEVETFELVKELISEAHSRQGRPREQTVVVDVGCSIGTHAIECSRIGFRSFGLDFDKSAIDMARQLNSEEGTRAEFHQMDVSDWGKDFPRIDIAVCADIFEHLHDDELGSLLVSLRKNFSDDGILVFHTAPQEFDYLFWRKEGQNGMIVLPWVLWPFKWLSDEHFTRVTRIAALALDMWLVATRGKTYKEHIKMADHPNPLTTSRLADLLRRAGYEILTVATRTSDAQIQPRHRDLLRARTVTHRSLYGLARPRKK